MADWEKNANADFIAKELTELKLKEIKGSANQCPHCNRGGSFGSITQFKTLDNKIWLICGWCGYVVELK